ncbi:ornithine cyclodeaminase [Rhodobacteraceae bacterium IMCC15231]|nr:ornithine cyclodeaminase [Rhodobacteraceae bacterium IMCC15231]
MSAINISFDQGDPLLDWLGLTAAFEAGHKRPKAEIADTFLYRGKDTLLSRAAWIDGLGIAVKAATIFPDNPSSGRPMVNGGVNLFSDKTGALEAIIDFHLVTKWKTAADSLWAAKRLARPESKHIVIIGAGTVASNLLDAYRVGFPEARFSIWNRSPERAQALAKTRPEVRVVTDLKAAIGSADIICTSTMSTSPVLQGSWLQEGQHVDLIGAYRPDMREVDDQALQRARVFVDSFDTTLDHIGELKIPLSSGVLRRADVQADYYSERGFQRVSERDITLFKNGGGAHLDLMTARYILQQWSSAA